MFGMLLLMLPLMVIPVIAIGSQNVENNPHRTELAPGEVEFLLPSGLSNGLGGIMDHRYFKDASKFKIRNAPTLDVDDLINMNSGDLTYENKWCLIPLQTIHDAIDLMVSGGVIDPIVGQAMKDAFEAMFPEGYYLMFVKVVE